MKFAIIEACSDLGLDVDGTNLGPSIISKRLNNDNIKSIISLSKNNVIKEHNEENLKKNFNDFNIFNAKLFNAVRETIKNDMIPITIGGDHGIAIGSALASIDMNDNLGIIWVDAHLDYNTFETTITGNLHGLPLAAINGLCKDLTEFSNNKFYNPKNTVVVGYRADEENKLEELANIEKSGVTVFTNDDINKFGIEEIMKKAIAIASDNTNGIHISFDLDIIDSNYAPGVSVKEENGIDLDTAYKITDIISNNLTLIKSFDLVEYNPLLDIDDKTLDIATNIINKIVNKK